MPPLPVCSVGAPPGPPPGASHPPPEFGGMRAIGVPPELRRRAAHATQEASDVADRIRFALRRAQLKLLYSQWKLQSAVEARRNLVMRE